MNIEILVRTDSDYKSHLIEWAQKNKQEIIFESREEIKSVNNNPLFITHVKLQDKVLGRGIGDSKKESEQKAARNALDQVSKRTEDSTLQ